MRASSSTTRMRVRLLMGPSYPLSDRMPARPRRSAVPNLKVYRAAWVVALILVVISLFTLGRPDTPKLSLEPVSFDGEQAAADLRTIVTDYPQRVALGERPDVLQGGIFAVDRRREAVDVRLEAGLLELLDVPRGQPIVGVSAGGALGVIGDDGAKVGGRLLAVERHGLEAEFGGVGPAQREERDHDEDERHD